jgi:hypothetical protein
MAVKSFIKSAPGVARCQIRRRATLEIGKSVKGIKSAAQCYKKFWAVICNYLNKLECMSMAGILNHGLMIVHKDQELTIERST